MATAAANQFFEVWPENWPTFLLFSELETQWNFAASGHRTGLQYLVLFAKLDRMALPPDEYDETEHDIRAMELAALAAMNEPE